MICNILKSKQSNDHLCIMQMRFNLQHSSCFIDRLSPFAQQDQSRQMSAFVGFGRTRRPQILVASFRQIHAVFRHRRSGVALRQFQTRRLEAGFYTENDRHRCALITGQRHESTGFGRNCSLFDHTSYENRFNFCLHKVYRMIIS